MHKPNMENMINVSKIFEIAQTQKEFSITWIAEDGHRVIVNDAVFTKDDGFYSKGRTMNILCRNSIHMPSRISLKTFWDLIHCRNIKFT